MERKEQSNALKTVTNEEKEQFNQVSSRSDHHRISHCFYSPQTEDLASCLFHLVSTERIVPCGGTGGEVEKHLK